MEAANGALWDQIAFGSSFPFRAMAQSIADYERLDFGTMCGRNCSSPMRPSFSVWPRDPDRLVERQGHDARAEANSRRACHDMKAALIAIKMMLSNPG